MNDLIENVKQGLRHCSDLNRCNVDCPYSNIEGMDNCITRLASDALSVIEWLTSNEGAIHVLRNSHWMQNHDHEMTADGTLFMKWLAELMLNTDDEPIKPSEIINRIDQGGFSRFVDDWKDGEQDV